MRSRRILSAVAVGTIGLVSLQAAGIGDASPNPIPPPPPDDIVGLVFQAAKDKGLTGDVQLTVDGDTYRFTPTDEAGVPDPAAQPVDFTLDVDTPIGEAAVADQLFGIADPVDGQQVGSSGNGAWFWAADGPGGQFDAVGDPAVDAFGANDILSVQIGRVPTMLPFPTGDVDTSDVLFGEEGPVAAVPGPPFVVTPGATPDQFGDDLIFFQIGLGEMLPPDIFCEVSLPGIPFNQPDPLIYSNDLPGAFFDGSSHQPVIQVEPPGDVYASILFYDGNGFPESGQPMMSAVAGNSVFGIMNADDFPAGGPTLTPAVYCSGPNGGGADTIQLLPGPVSLLDGLPVWAFVEETPPPTTTSSTTTTSTSTTTTTIPPSTSGSNGNDTGDGDAGGESDGGSNTVMLVLFGALALLGMAGLGYGLYLLSKRDGPCKELIDAWALAQKDCADKAAKAAEAQARTDALQDRLDTLTDGYEPLGFEDSGSSFESGGETIDSIDAQLERWHRSSNPGVDLETGPGTAEDATGTAERARSERAEQRHRLREEYDRNKADADQLQGELEGAETARDAAETAAKEACEKAEAARKAMQICLHEHETPPVVIGGPSGPSTIKDPESGGPCDRSTPAPEPEELPPPFVRGALLVDVSIIIQPDVGHGDKYEAERMAHGFGELSTLFGELGRLVTGGGAAKSILDGGLKGVASGAYGAGGVLGSEVGDGPAPTNSGEIEVSDLMNVPTSLPALGAEYGKRVTDLMSKTAAAAGRWAEHNSTYDIKLVRYMRRVEARRTKIWECVDGQWRCRVETSVEWGQIRRVTQTVRRTVLGDDVEAEAGRWLNIYRSRVQRDLGNLDRWLSDVLPGACR